MVEIDLKTLLRAICPRSYPDFAPVSTARPYVTYQQFGGEAPAFLDKTVPSKENAEFQINVWSDSRLEAKTIIKQIEVAMIGATAFQARPIAACASDFDADVPVYCSRQDFTVWADR